MGTSVAFYLGFKNNQAYDRLWEARKIWGALLNNSRILMTMIKHFIEDESTDPVELEQSRRKLINRIILYVYTLRGQLLKPAEWEQISQSGNMGIFNRNRAIIRIN
ncbi:hypothetical protein IM793_06240 [Pedobacter sp. MR2016-19]|uniref:bestrophin family ion channel n=1 Tax=Pedobacter sp. MR2016-19 TaxID=2780089 RepID=UPI0018749868|nr:hypothetical protein [Pedobacter sp. MR2016-19]